jgi:UDP-N-acetylmuramyl pentapeptide phosphotransferase/UDP-N-acetylglucosamine-1-phosphate transferase
VLALVCALLVGYLIARLAWIALSSLFASPALARTNYRGRPLPTAAGIVVALSVLLVEGGRALAGSFGVGNGPGLTVPRGLVLLIAVAFGLLGLLDDIAGSDAYRGFRGHVSALLAGQLTTGGLKLIGGAAVSLVAVGPLVGKSPGRLVADALLVALCANLANLLDAAPGRATKVGAAAFVLLVIGVGAPAALVAPAIVVGGSLGLLLDDLKEHLMLGDAGSNALGAVLGIAIVLTCAQGVRDVILVLVVALNVAGELVSFTRVIDAVPPLRFLDRAGRRR